MAHVTSRFSYYPLAPARTGPAEASEVAPECGPDETDVWLTEWQVAEEGLDVAVGDAIVWALVPMDQTWARRLFGDRRVITLQLDTYAAATRDPSHPEWAPLSGRVTRIDQVSTPVAVTATDSVRPALGAGVEHEVSTLRSRRAHDGGIVGWVVRVRSRAERGGAQAAGSCPHDD